MLRFSMVIALLACATAPAYAQYDRYDRAQECWNPRAGHFEGVRPGETQNDLDFSRCRPVGEYRGSDRRGSDRDVPRECWNPRAGHFEGVRPRETQNDLDFSRCRPVGDDRAWGDARCSDRDVPRECWNPRAGHFEEVRPGERQDDLDFSRCRRH